MTKPTDRFADALPPYIGGKRKLARLILALLERELPRDAWARSSLLDPFSGGGSFALFAKAFGFAVTASDIAARASLVARALIANSSIRLTQRDIVGFFETMSVPVVGPSAPFVGSVFTVEQAAFIDGGLAHAQRQIEPLRSLLLLVMVKLVLRLFPMSTPAATDAKAALRGDFDRVSPRRVGHYLKARALLTPAELWRIAQDVNAGVFAGYGTALQIDAMAAIVSNPVDVLYLDPPYPGTTRYGTHYAVLDRLLSDAPSEMPNPSIDDMLDAAQHVPFVVISYGGPTSTLGTLSGSSPATAPSARPSPSRMRISDQLPRRSIVSTTANSSSSHAAEPGLLRIPLELIHPHPLNANAMSDDISDKVARNIERTHKYPPLLVRSHPDLPGEFQLIDGEQRWRILPRIGEHEALCYVWECADETALLLLATINRLRGGDVPGLRSALLAELDRLLPRDVLETLLPEDACGLDDAITFAKLDPDALLADLTAAAQRSAVDGPRLISFAVTPEDEAVIERAVVAASEGLTGANRRGRALAEACRHYLEVSCA